jgi:hypothetical protein
MIRSRPKQTLCFMKWTILTPEMMTGKSGVQHKASAGQYLATEQSYSGQCKNELRS